MKSVQIQVNLLIEQVSIAISFPCKMFVQLKVDSQKIDATKETPLEKGVARFEEKASVQVAAQFDEAQAQFIDAKVLLTHGRDYATDRCQHLPHNVQGQQEGWHGGAEPRRLPELEDRPEYFSLIN